MIEIDSGDVMLMRDESFVEMLDEINTKARQTRIAVVLCWIGIAVGILAGLATGGMGLLLAGLALPGWAIGSWFDSYRRSTVLFYDLEGDAEDAYNRLTNGFDGLRNCDGKWHIEAGGAVTNLTAWKRNAGASHLVKKKPTNLSYALPSVIKSNVTPPALHVGRQVLYFLPDVALIEDNGRLGAVSYAELDLRWQDSRFIEDGQVPRDARVVDHTWKHPNKNGGPDRRFRDNRQIPICLYEVLHFQSRTGINELVEFSQTGKAAAFADGCTRLANLPKERTLQLPSSLEGAATQRPLEAIQDTPAPRRWIRTAAFSVLAIVVALPLFGALIASNALEPATPSEPGFEKLNIEPASSLSSDAANSAEPAASATPGISSTPEPLAPIAPPSSTPAIASTPGPANTTPVANSQGTVSTRYRVNLREGPGTTFRILKTLPSSAFITVIEQQRSWSRIQTDDGMSGWITSDAIK